MVKDILRGIKKKWFQFIAILIITALGVGFFVGIQVTGYNMRVTADQYTKTNEIMDFYLSSSLGVDQEMVDELSLDLDAKVFGLIDGDAFIRKEGFDQVVKAYDYNDNTKKDLTLSEGRLPILEGEIVVDALMAEHFDIAIGDVLTLGSSDILKSREVTVVGLGNSSLYFNQERGQSKLGRLNGFIYVQGLESKDDIFTGIRVIANEDVDPLTIKESIESIKDELMLGRYYRITEPIKEDLIKAQSDLEKANYEVNEKFEDAWNKILHEEMLLTDAKNEVINGILELNPETKGSHYQEYYDNSIQYFTQLKTETTEQFKQAQEQIDLMPEGLEKDFASMELIQKIEMFQADMLQVDAAHQVLKQGIDEIVEGDKAIVSAKDSFQKEKKDALASISEGQKEIDDGYKKLDEMDKGSFYIINRDGIIIGYSAFYDDSKRIESIGKVFPLVFFGVAILVTLSTITRMIEESRVEIGIYKALGFSRMRTTLKFTGFTFFSWLIGSGLGLALGFLFIPVLIYNAYRIMYITPELQIGFIGSYAWIPLLLSFLSCVGIAFVKAQSVAKNTTASLLMPPSPKGGQRVFLERFGFIWNNLTFLYKVSLRNLFRNKTRFLMTLVGIGGCCGLLITGFGIQYSINSIVDKQFDEIIQYDAVVAYDKEFNVNESLILDSPYTEVAVENVTVDNKEVSIYAVDDLNDLESKVHFKDRLSGKALKVSNDDVIISEKLAIIKNIKVGDTLEFNQGDKVHQVKVSQITENYVAHYIYMSKDTFKTVMGYSIDPSIILMQEDSSLGEGWDQGLRNEAGVLSVNILGDMKSTYKDMMGSFDVVILVIVVAAFALELIVLLNLITMNMSERYKELATLKVLGFYPKELSSYVLRENIILSLLSLFVGIIFGTFLHKFVLLSAEIDMIMFNRVLKPSAVVWACLLTFAMSMIINLVMSRGANKVNMAEALKSQ